MAYADTLKKLMELNPNGATASYMNNKGTTTSPIAPSSVQTYKPYRDDTELDALPNRVTTPALADYVKSTQPQPQATQPQSLASQVVNNSDTTQISAPIQAPVQTQTPTQTPAPQQQNYAKDNSALYTQMYDSALQSTISRIKEAVAKGKSQQQGIIDKAPGQYQPLRDQASYKGEVNQQNLREMLSNQGQQGGVNRTEMTQVNTATENQINDLNLQQQNVINDANKTIAELESQGLFDEAQATADNANQRLQALIQESNRVDETNYGRLRDYVGDTRYADETSYNRGRDTVSDTRYADETQYNRGRDVIGDTRYNQEYTDQRGDVQYNRDYQSLRDQVSDTGRLADGTYTQAGQANLTNEQIRQADLEEKTNPNSVTNQLAKLGLDTAKLNYAALPTQIKNEAQILAQNVQKGVIDVKVANAQLSELTNPNSVTNQLNKLGLQTAKLNYAALPAQLKGEADKLAQDLQSGRIKIATAQAQLNNLKAGKTKEGKSTSTTKTDKPAFTEKQLSDIRAKAITLATDKTTGEFSVEKYNQMYGILLGQNTNNKSAYDNNMQTIDWNGYDNTSAETSRLANQVQPKATTKKTLPNTNVTTKPKGGVLPNNNVSANTKTLYSSADSVPSTSRQKWYTDNKSEIDKFVSPSELSAFKSKYKLK